MACARFERAEQARFDCKTQVPKVPEDVVGSQRHMAFDVFEEAPFGIDFTDDPSDLGPQMAGIVLAAPVAGKGEGLAGISASDDMNLSTPRLAVEAGKVTPDRRRIQGLVAHPRHESGRSEGFPLNVTDSAISRLRNMQSEFKAADSGAECQAVEWSVLGM